MEKKIHEEEKILRTTEVLVAVLFSDYQMEESQVYKIRFLCDKRS